MQISMLRTGKLKMFFLKKSGSSLVLVVCTLQLVFLFVFLKESSGVELFTQGKIDSHKSSVQLQYIKSYKNL